MKPLSHPDVLHLKAAEGWLDLGCTEDARWELNQIRPRLRRHPDVLEVKWQILAAQERWESCLDVASELIRAVPERASGWIRLSYALHEIELTEDAYENLLGVADQFPLDPLIPYNLACYCCRLGFFEEAKDWMKQSMHVSVPEKIRETALADEDLRPLWQEIKGL